MVFKKIVLGIGMLFWLTFKLIELFIATISVFCYCCYMEQILPVNTIEKKIKLSLELYELAYKIKNFQLKQKYPTKTLQEIHKMTLELIESAASR